jgi:hypothetical protein
MKAIGITDFLNKTFDVYEIEGEWLDSFGFIEKNFKISVTGKIVVIVISWSKGDKPKNQAARDIEYMSCIKVFVKDGKAYPRSRFGGNKTFTIFEKKSNVSVQKTLFES